MTGEINFIPESVLLCYNHQAAQLTRAHSYCHQFPFQYSSQVISTKTPVHMLLLVLNPTTHIKPDSQMVHATAFSQSESNVKKKRIHPEGEWQRVLQLYTFIFSHRHASRFSLFYSCLSHHTNAHFCLFSIPHSNAISHATYHHPTTATTLHSQKLSCFIQFNSQEKK